MIIQHGYLANIFSNMNKVSLSFQIKPLTVFTDNDKIHAPYTKNFFRRPSLFFKM